MSYKNNQVTGSLGDLNKLFYQIHTDLHHKNYLLGWQPTEVLRLTLSNQPLLRSKPNTSFLVIQLGKNKLFLDKLSTLSLWEKKKMIDDVQV